MNPIAFHAGSLTIYWYGIMAAAGFLLATLVMRFTRNHADMRDDDVSNAMIIAMFSGLIGARIFYVVQFFDQYRNNLADIIRVDKGGLVFYGGFLLALAALIVYCKIKKKDAVSVLDACAPALAVGHACGRIGCFLHGCCFGKPAAFLGVHYPAQSAACQTYGNAALYPVQLFEAGANLAVFWLFFQLARKAGRGIAMSSYLIYYGTLRFCMELMRGDNTRYWGLFTQAQLIGLILIPVGIILLIYFKSGNKNAVSKDHSGNQQ